MSGNAADGVWRNCNICKKGIGFGAEYFVCSVSTCNRKRTGLIFCGLPCFEAHLPEARHRDAWAEQVRSPSRAEWEAALAAEKAAADAGGSAPSPAAPSAGGERRHNVSATAEPPRNVTIARTAADTGDEQRAESEVLVVVSKLKKYIRDWSGMNTSDGAVPVLSEYLRELCREAIRQAGLDGRRTVLDRDFVKVIAARREEPRPVDFDSRR
jgi:hypothetical protein